MFKSFQKGESSDEEESQNFSFGNTPKKSASKKSVGQTMNPTLFDWSAKHAEIISESSQIPPDIVFKFREADNVDTEVLAHKIILSMVSKVFRNMFFVHNTQDKYAKEIVVEDTSKPAFQIMINSIYSIKSMRESLQGKSIDEIFAVLYVVTKYEIPELVNSVKLYLSSIPLTEDNVLDVAENALEYSATFEEAVQNLLLACAKFLKPKVSGGEAFIRYVAENGDRIATVYKLAVLMADLPPAVKVAVKRGRTSGVGESGTKLSVKKRFGSTEVCPKCLRVFWSRDSDEHRMGCKFK